VVRQGQLIVVMLVVLVVLLYPSPAYAQVDTSAGQLPPRYSVEAGTPLTVLGRYHGPDPNCPPPERPCKPYTWAVVQLPNQNVVLLPPSLVNYQTQTARSDTETSKPLTPEQVNEVLGLTDTGGAALLPLLGAVMLIGGGLVAGQLLTRTRYAG
jgi:hypothetical protein